MSVNEFPPPLAEFDFNWSKYQTLVDWQYERFRADFIKTRTFFNGMEIEVPTALQDGKELVFWHIITRDINHGGSRQPDGERAIRAHWLKAIITNHSHPDVSYFVHEHSNGRNRHYFWVRSCNYLVILEQRAGRLHIITGYIVDKKYMLQDLETKLNAHLEANPPNAFPVVVDQAVDPD